MNTSLSKPIVGSISAENSYKTIVNTYNTAADAYNLAGIITGKSVQKVTDNSLSSYTTNKALTGLFFKVSQEEKDIRTDPLARVNDLLKYQYHCLLLESVKFLNPHQPEPPPAKQSPLLG